MRSHKKMFMKWSQFLRIQTNREKEDALKPMIPYILDLKLNQNKKKNV